MKNIRAIANFRQLCCLGLGGEAIMPALLQALDVLIPSSSKSFLWMDENYNLTNMCQEPVTPEVTELYLAEFYNKRELDAWPGARKSMLGEDPDVGWLLQGVDKKRFYKSDFYNLCWRPRDSYDPIRARVRDGRRLFGTVVLSRGRKDKPFVQSDLTLLAQLVPYISHALLRCDGSDPCFVDSGEAGLVILDGAGRLRYLSERARQVLFYVTHPDFSPERVSTARGVSVPPVLSGLVKNLVELFAGNPAAPPVLSHQNAWGRFVFRAYWLEEPHPKETGEMLSHYHSGDALVGVTVQYQEPVSLKLLRAMRELPLSIREKEVCLLLAQGLTYAAIAARLHVCRSSVITYVRKIYEKLDVHSHEKLLQKLGSV